VPDARREAGSLLSFVIGKDRTFLISHAEDPVDDDSFDRMREFVGRRAAGEPLQYITGFQDELTTLVEPKDDVPFVLHPGEFVLGSTLEVVTLPDDLAGRLEGKSSLGRLGLLTHSTAGFIDPGFSGHITLELSNVANLPIMLWPGMKIGQLCLFRLSSAAEHPYGSAIYGSRYQGQRGPTPSRSYQNFRTWPTT